MQLYNGQVAKCENVGLSMRAYTFVFVNVWAFGGLLLGAVVKCHIAKCMRASTLVPMMPMAKY